MVVEIDNEDWSDDPLVFAVYCRGHDYLGSKWQIFQWLKNNLGEDSKKYKARWRWQAHLDQDNYFMFSVTFCNEEDAMAFKLVWGE